MYKRILIATFTIIGLYVLLGFLPIHSEAAIYDNVLRLHVLANSDSSADQSLKLEVRDRILEETATLFKDCKTKDEAREAVESNLDKIREIAEQTVREAGYDYSVSVSLGEEEYPTKNYEECCFPAGEYLSLRVMIGEAEGENWWCVLFPPLCIDAAGESREVFAEVGLTDEQYSFITETDNPKYKVRFKLLEVIEGALS
ncbi:MAG: stage II sporulation protein R [Clostridia bacterium]|nr:stage II sporulation protein R [Clostridia bacterium]